MYLQILIQMDENNKRLNDMNKSSHHQDPSCLSTSVASPPGEVDDEHFGLIETSAILLGIPYQSAVLKMTFLFAFGGIFVSSLEGRSSLKLRDCCLQGSKAMFIIFIVQKLSRST